MFFQDFKSRDILKSRKCPLHSAFYALRIRVSVMELYGAELLISHTFQCMFTILLPVLH